MKESNPTMSTVLLASDYVLSESDLYLAVIAKLKNRDLCVVHDIDSACAALRPEIDLQLIVLDLPMAGVKGMGGLIVLRHRVPTVPIVVITDPDVAPSVSEAFALGASGVLLKPLSSHDLVEALSTVMEGGIYFPLRRDQQEWEEQPLTPEEQVLAEQIDRLTKTQRRVLEMLVEGKSNKIMAFDMKVSESTVKQHVSSILRKLDVTSRTQAVIRVRKFWGDL